MSTNTLHAKFLTVYKIIIMSLSFLSIGLCAVCTALFYDYSPGYFRESALCSIFSVSMTLTSLFALTSFFASKKTFKIKSPENSNAPYFLYLIPACGFLFYSISIFPEIFKTTANRYILLAHALFSLVSFIYFLICNLNTKIDADAKSILGLISIACPMLIAIRSYFDYSMVMNSPEKIYLQITMVSFALYIINEARFILGAPYPRFYIALSGLIFPLSSCYTANKIFIIANTNKGSESEDIALCVLMASIAIYSLFRIICISKAEEPTLESTIEETEFFDFNGNPEFENTSSDDNSEANH